MPKAPKAIMRSPLASPSSPSVKFTAFAVARMMKINNGMYSQPISMFPTHGMLMVLNPNFSKNQYAPTPAKIVSHASLNFALRPFVFPIPLMLR